MKKALAAGALVGAGFWIGVLVTSNGLDLVDRALRRFKP